MPLFWLVHEIDGERRVSIQEGSTLNFARLDAVIAGVEGVFVGGRMLDERHAKKVPKNMVGRALTDREVRALIDRMA